MCLAFVGVLLGAGVVACVGAPTYGEDAPLAGSGGKTNGSGDAGSSPTGDAATGASDDGATGAPADGSVSIGDAAMPTSCTIAPSGPIAFIPTDTMAPGTGCGGCHATIGKPLFVSGTVYPTYHEPDLCMGTPSIQTEIVDATNASHLLDVGSSGNFSVKDTQSWPFPWRVAVVHGSARRPMVGTVTTGDCNSCHTAPGAQSAPGRILSPDVP